MKKILYPTILAIALLASGSANALENNLVTLPSSLTVNPPTAIGGSCEDRYIDKTYQCQVVVIATQATGACQPVTMTHVLRDPCGVRYWQPFAPGQFSNVQACAAITQGMNLISRGYILQPC